MSDNWCKCRIVEPKIRQVRNTLVCQLCYEQKDLPPSVDFKWALLKKKLLARGRLEYETFSKQGLIDLLLKRDELLLEKWNVPLESDYLGPYYAQKHKQEQMIKEIESHIHYITFKTQTKQKE